MKSFGGYGFGYGYLEKSHPKYRTNIASSGTAVRTHIMESDSQMIYASQGLATNQNLNDILTLNQRHNSVPRKNSSGRYSLLNIENYAPPPSQFIQEFAATTSKPTTKSTDNLIAAYNISNSSINSCDCNATESKAKIHKQKPQTKDCIGYYSNLPKSGINIAKILPIENIKNAESVSTDQARL